MSDWEQAGSEVMVKPPSLILRQMDTVTRASGDREQRAGGTLWTWTPRLMASHAEVLLGSFHAGV